MGKREQLLEISAYQGDGYAPVVDYENWRVAILNYCEELEPQNIRTMQRHNETDEVFVLLRGSCQLLIGAGEERITDIFLESMEPYKIYNVKRSVWHNHTLSKDGMVLIIENRNTGSANSDEIALTEVQRAEVAALFQRHSGTGANLDRREA